MVSSLSGFLRALRIAGVPVSTAETIDAAQTLRLIGWSDRARLKDALGVVLAKSAQAKAIHDQVFEMYFSLQASNVLQIDLQIDLQFDLQRAAHQVGVDEIRFASQESFYVRQMLNAMGIATLEARLLERMAESTAEAQAQVQALSAEREHLTQQARHWVAQRFELFGRPATENFMAEVAVRRPLGRMGPHDMQRMQVAVTRMAKRLAQKHSHRQRMRMAGRIDLSRTLKANAGHGGVPFDLHFKHRRRDKPRLVVVCDVSGSVVAQVRFLLLFLYALQGSVADVRSFAFAHRLFDVSAPLAQLPFEEAMNLILKEVGSGATDYGQAWLDLQQRHEDCIDRRTTLLVLGDGRSNHADPRLDLFAQLADRAKRVVWLCNEPPVRWGSGDSCMLQYRPLCTHLTHCASATDLERAIDEALAAYA